MQPVYKKVRSLLVDQMEQLEESDILFAKVLLIGGFSESQALKGCIQSWLNENDLAVPVISAGMSAGIIVAKGAVLRALNKDHGPSRSCDQVSAYSVISLRSKAPNLLRKRENCLLASPSRAVTDHVISWTVSNGSFMRYGNACSLSTGWLI
jgi:hypothetical protein